MYIDAQTKLSDSQVVTTSAASTNVIDLGAARDIGVGGRLQLFIGVNAAAAASGAATINFQIQTATDQAFTAPITIAQTDALPKTALAQGFSMYMPLPIGLNKRYMRLFYNVGTGPLTAGSFTAAVVESPQSSPTYAAPYQA